MSITLSSKIYHSQKTAARPLDHIIPSEIIPSKQPVVKYLRPVRVLFYHLLHIGHLALKTIQPSAKLGYVFLFAISIIMNTDRPYARAFFHEITNLLGNPEDSFRRYKRETAKPVAYYAQAVFW
jgi:hypothetical protein